MKTGVIIFHKTVNRKRVQRDFRSWIWEVSYILKELLIEFFYALLGFLTPLYLISLYFR